MREALSLGHNYIGTEHVLLGVVREGEGVGCQVLEGFGLDGDRVRNRVIRMVSGRAGVEYEQEQILTDRWPPPWTGYARPQNVSEAELLPVVRSEPTLLRGILIGWALAGVTLGSGLLVGWLIWG